MVLVYLQICGAHNLALEHFHHPAKKPVDIKCSLPISPSPKSLATTDLLSPYRFAFLYISFLNGIIQHMVSCLSLSICFEIHLCLEACTDNRFL